MTRRYVNQLTNGDALDTVYLVADKQVRANRQGSLYLHLDLRDRTGVLGARLWNVTEDQARRFDPGDYVHVRGKVQVYQGALQLILAHIDPVPPETQDAEEFLPQGGPDIARLTARLRELLMSLRDPNLSALAQCFLIDQAFLARFTAAPAGVRNHHAYRGGLLEHVVTMMGVADRVAEFYPDVNRDLLLMGVFLHDVGKIDELSYDHAFSYTDEGQLVGHLVLGVALLREKARRATDLTDEPFPREHLLRLEHMIVSHHGTHEFGSPVVPMTPEAIALHYLDNLDAKLHVFTREIRDDPSRGSSWTPFHPNLGRRLFKGDPGANGEAETDPGLNADGHAT
jgi:3'-5' exoribonuclease